MTTPTIQTETLRYAVEPLTDHYLAFDLAERLTCRELDAIVYVMLLIGDDDAATYWVECHTETDEEGDRHHKVSPPEYIETMKESLS